MNRVLMIRHGATAGNLERRYIGRTDEPLCPLGVEQIEHLRQAGLKAELLFVSPMLRTRQTAQLLFPGMPCTAVEGFRETDFGIFEGKTAAELSGTPAYQAWVDALCKTPIPGGEAVETFKARCCEAFRQTMAEVPEGVSAAFVVHGGVIMAILEAYGRPKRDFYDYHIGNGAYLACTWEDGVLAVE